ncbi:MAG TPA: PPC domain-containing protein, partial [Sedimentisphaerales bacterium]|nr:PPC domain-containing protein [Sedimentisphaerales bacterium]
IGVVAPDGDEENDTRETAKDVGYVSGTWTRDNLTIDSVEDVDWYKFTILGPGTTLHRVQIDFMNTEGDLALALYRADGTLVGSVSDGVTNIEKVSLAGLVDGDYYVKVWSQHQDVSRKYKLTMVAPAPPDLAPTGVDSTVWQSAEPGTVVDWTVVVKNNGPGYQRADWKVEWYLSNDPVYQATDPLIGSGTYTDDIAPGASVNKSIAAPVPAMGTAGQKYVIARVTNLGPEGTVVNNVKVGTDPDWIGVVAPDGDEENDTRETAKDVGYVSGTWTRDNLTIDSVEDVDWYKFTILGPGTTLHRVQIDFVNTEGDLALALYRADGTLVGSVSDGVTNIEKGSLAGLADGDYYVKVWSPRRDVSRKYKLTMVA